MVGLSSLRQHEPKSNEPSEQSKELQAYLSKYTGDSAGVAKKAKQKRKKVARPQPGGVRIFEEDNTGFQRNSVQVEVTEDAEDEGIAYRTIQILSDCVPADCCCLASMNSADLQSDGCMQHCNLCVGAEGPVVANPEEAERAMRQVQKLQAGGALEAWEEVPMIVGDVPKTGHPPKDSPDLSPPRRGRHDSPEASVQKNRQRELSRQQDSADISHARDQAGSVPRGSPVRQQKRSRHDSPDLAPQRRMRHDSPDASPPRRSRQASPDASPPRKQRHDSPDASPPRRRRQVSPDANNTKRQRHDSPDASPPRRQTQASPDQHPPKRSRHDSPDASPPRRRRDDGSDTSPPRKPGMSL